MATLNTDTSVVDYLKSTGGDSSFSSRAQLAVKQGIVKSPDQYVGSVTQNTSLLTKLRAGSSTTPTAVATKDDATKFINGKQDEDIAAGDAADAPPSRIASSDLVDAFKTLTGKSSLVPDYTVEAPNFEQTYDQLRQTYNVSDLEQSINDLDAQEQEIQARLRERTNLELDKPVALNVISGRIGEVERQELERLDYIGRQKSRAIAELQTANNVIETKMNLKKMDYDVAKGEYDTQFSQNIQLFNTIKGIAEFDISEQERQEDNARANLQIMYDSIRDGGLDVNNLEPSTEAKITSLELKAGLPSGFYNTIAKSNPEGKILSTTTRTVGGTKYADVIMKNPDGSLTTQQVTLGATSEGSGGGDTKLSEAELSRAARSEIANQLNTRRGEDGYVSNGDYKKARNAWVSKGFSATDFNESFAREYVNPDFPEAYGVSLDLII